MAEINCRYCGGTGKIRTGEKETLTPQGVKLVRKAYRPCPHCAGSGKEEKIR